QLLKTLQFLEQIHHLIHGAGPQYHFDHSKIREILYDSIPPELRIEYHTVVGQFLAESFGESEEHAGVIAFNLLAAGLKSEALPYLILSATAAARLFAHAEAIARYGTLVEEARGSGDESRLNTALRELGKLHFFKGDMESAERFLREAIGMAEARGDERLRAASLNNLSGIHFVRGDMEEAFMCHRTCLGIRQRLGDDAGLAQTHKNIGILHLRLGEPQEAE